MFYPMTMMMMFARSISFCCCCLSVFYSDCFHCIFSVCFVFGSTNQCRLCYKQSVLFIENYYQQKNKSSIDIVLEKIENNNIIKCISQVIWQYHHHPNHRFDGLWNDLDFREFRFSLSLDHHHHHSIVIQSGHHNYGIISAIDMSVCVCLLSGKDEKNEWIEINPYGFYCIYTQTLGTQTNFFCF